MSCKGECIAINAYVSLGYAGYPIAHSFDCVDSTQELQVKHHDTHLALKNIQVLRNDDGDEHRIDANTVLFGQNMHVTLIRVDEDDSTQEAFFGDDEDELCRLREYACPRRWLRNR